MFICVYVLRNWWGVVWMMTFLALAHMYATQLMGWGVDDDFPCTCSHVCYATDGVGCGWWLSLHLHTCEMLRNWWGGVWMITFLALAHMYAAQLMGWGVDDNFPCTCTHVRCYATDGVRCGWWLSWWTSQLYIDALIQMALYCNFSWWYSNTLQDCTPLQFLETKTGAPLVVLHPPPCQNAVVVSTFPED